MAELVSGYIALRLNQLSSTPRAVEVHRCPCREFIIALALDGLVGLSALF